VVAATAVSSEAELIKLDVVVWCGVKKVFNSLQRRTGVML
jgi:hypothetical protein